MPSSSSADPAALLTLATDISQEAGALLASYAKRSDLDVDTKTTATDPVSAADRASERLISDRVRAARPDDGLMGEEHAGDRAGSSGLRWVVDPLDGTVNFLYGIPQWSVSIAVEDGAGPLCGVVHDPSRNETFTAVRGSGAWADGSALRIVAPRRVGDALIASGFSYDPKMRRRQATLLVDLIDSVRDIRRFGSAALDLAWLAAGRWDGYAEFALHRWDYSAGSLIVQEAGGSVAHWELTLDATVRTGLSAGSALVAAHLDTWLSRGGARPIER